MKHDMFTAVAIELFPV